MSTAEGSAGGLLDPRLWLGRALAIHVNRVTREERAGRSGWRKQRLPGMGPVIHLGNVFMRRARTGVLMFPRPTDWQRWELAQLRHLYGPDFPCAAAGPRGLWIAQLPGDSLRALIQRGALAMSVVAALGRALAAAHARPAELLGGGWSHGDLHLGNALYDPADDSVRFIDFDARHDPALREAERHADDLLVPLLDLVGRLPREPALAAARALLGSYGRPALPDVYDLLRARLRVPSGLERVVYATRTGYQPDAPLAMTLGALRALVPGPQQGER